MSLQLDTAFVSTFQAMVISAYQQRIDRLRGYTRFQGDVTGKDVSWDIAGEIVAQERGAPQSASNILNLPYTRVTATLKDWEAKTVTDKFMAAKVLFSAKAEAAKATAASMARRMMQEILNAAIASSGTTVETTVGGAGTNLNFAKVRDARATLLAKNADGKACFCYHPNNIKSLWAEPEATSSDFVTIQRLNSGTFVDEWMGFYWVPIPNMTEGGLPIAGGVRDCFCWNEDAIGSAEWTGGLQTVITWENILSGHLVNAMWSGISKTLQADGIVKVQCTDAAGPA